MLASYNWNKPSLKRNLPLESLYPMLDTCRHWMVELSLDLTPFYLSLTVPSVYA